MLYCICMPKSKKHHKLLRTKKKNKNLLAFFLIAAIVLVGLFLLKSATASKSGHIAGILRTQVVESFPCGPSAIPCATLTPPAPIPCGTSTRSFAQTVGGFLGILSTQSTNRVPINPCPTSTPTLAPTPTYASSNPWTPPPAAPTNFIPTPIQENPHPAMSQQNPPPPVSTYSCSPNQYVAGTYCTGYNSCYDIYCSGSGVETTDSIYGASTCSFCASYTCAPGSFVAGTYSAAGKSYDVYCNAAGNATVKRFYN